MSERKGKQELVWKIIRALPLVAVVILFTVFIVKNGVSAIDSLVEKFHERMWLTTFAFLGLFLIKSVSFGLPYTILYIGIGKIYPLGWALLLNTVGIIVNMQVPYFIGRYARGGVTQKILGRFPQFTTFTLSKERSAVLVAFLAKLIGLIPHEISNLFLGTIPLPYWPYLLGGVLGLMPGMIATTVLGKNLHRPGSPIFIGTVTIVVLLIAISVLLYKRGALSSNEEE